jgi:hypothetical protein
MKFGIDACTKIVYKKGKLVLSRNLILDVGGEIQELEHGKTYMYLGIEESEVCNINR